MIPVTNRDHSAPDGDALVKEAVTYRISSTCSESARKRRTLGRRYGLPLYSEDQDAEVLASLLNLALHHGSVHYGTWAPHIEHRTRAVSETYVHSESRD